MNELIEVSTNENDEQIIKGRTLHEFLEVDSNYTTWFGRMVDYGFSQGEDFIPFLEESSGGRPKQDHLIKIDMAKELCMIQRSEKGKIARQYFIEVERAWNSPDMIMQRALTIANKRVENLKVENLQLQVTNSQLSVEKEVMKPKADYFDDLVDRNMLTGIRETAKLLNVKQKLFVDFLLSKKYLFRDKRGKLTPFARYDNDLFEMKESKNDTTGWAGTQTLITPKGRETFKLLLIN